MPYLQQKKFYLIDNRCAKNIECKIKLHTTTSSKVKKHNISLTPNRLNIQHLDFNNIKLKDYSGKLKNIDIDEASPYLA